MENSDSEYETEEAVVLVELNGIIDADLLLQQQNLTKILGIDTDEPLLQIDNCLFKGEYEDTLGTVVLYEPIDSSKRDGSEGNDSDFKFLCKTDTKLTMKRCFPQERSKENLTSTEVSSAVIQNGNSEKSLLASETKNTKKKNFISKKKKLIKPKPKNLQKSKEYAKKDKTSAVIKKNKVTKPKLRTSQQIVKNTAIAVKVNEPPSEWKHSEALNVEENNYKTNSGHFQSTESQSGEKKKVSEKRRKRCHGEANNQTANSDQTPKDSSNRKKIMKMQRNEVRVVDEAAVPTVKENTDLNILDNERKNAISSNTEVSVSEKNTKEEKMIEEKSILEMPVGTRNSSETQQEITSALEMNEEKLKPKEKIPQTLDNAVMDNEIQKNDTSASVSDLDAKKRPMTNQEGFPKAVDDTRIISQTKIQEKSILSNISQMNREAVEEERVVETLDNKIAFNESEIQVKDTLIANVSEIDKLEPLIEESITEPLGVIEANIESETHMKNVAASVSEMEENEKSVMVEGNVVKAMNNVVSSVGNVHDNNSLLNVSDVNECGILTGKAGKINLVFGTEVVEQLVESSDNKASIVCGQNVAKDSENLSSCGNMEHIHNKNISEQIDVCESSDDTVNLHPVTSVSEKIDSSTSLPIQEMNENTAKKKIEMENDRNDTQLNTAGLNSTEKDTCCAVSESANVEVDVRELEEIEAQYSSVNSADDLALNNIDNLNPVSASDMISLPVSGEVKALNARNHSSCDVTQSLIPEGEYSKNKNLVSENKVFIPLQEENLENSATTKPDNQFQIVVVEQSQPSLKSGSIASEISQSCQESNFTEENSQVEFETDGAICSQSIDQSMMLPEVPSEGKDLCVSSCGIDGDFEENIEKEVHFNLGGYSKSEENEKNVICEVSQSDESENNITALSESSEIEAKVISNECDESIPNAEESVNVTTNQHICKITGSIQDAANTPSTSSTSEITQSCSSKAGHVYSLPFKKKISNECNEYEARNLSIGICDDKSKSDCVSSADTPAICETLSEIEADSIERDPTSEVSQSFRPAKKSAIQ